MSTKKQFILQTVVIGCPVFDNHPWIIIHWISTAFTTTMKAQHVGKKKHSCWYVAGIYSGLSYLERLCTSLGGTLNKWYAISSWRFQPIRKIYESNWFIFSPSIEVNIKKKQLPPPRFVCVANRFSSTSSSWPHTLPSKNNQPPTPIGFPPGPWL